jgi:hypothetical protein
MEPTKIYKGKKTFDCLKMKEELQAIVYEKTKDMTTEELLAYFKKSREENSIFKWD